MDSEIDPAELQDVLDDGRERRIVDIRSPAAFRRGHIPGSVNIPFENLPDRVGTLAGAEHIVTVCPHGKASVQAARLIASFEGTTDATVESLHGGLEAWDGPLEQGEENESASADIADTTDTTTEPDEGPNPDAPF
jgi:rhodanese-related sulfurtransferase